MNLTSQFANKAYDILVEAGANEEDRNSFIFHHVSNSTSEWRFAGKLGFGGKYYSRENFVSCYREDETKERLKLIDEINEKLSTINYPKYT